MMINFSDHLNDIYGKTIRGVFYAIVLFCAVASCVGTIAGVWWRK